MSENLNNEITPVDALSGDAQAIPSTPDGSNGSTNSNADPMSEWSQAMAEQQSAHQSKTGAIDQEKAAPANLFKSLDAQAPKTGEGFDINMIKDIPVQLSVELGRTRILIRELLQLGQGSVVELSTLAGEPMDIFINGFYIAQGEVVVAGENYGVRLTDIVTPSERLARLSAKR